MNLESTAMSTMGAVIDGLLRADGTVELDTPPRMPPGRVRVILQSLDCPGAERLPDDPWLDDSISAPFDLPRLGTAERIQPRTVAERWPELPTGLAKGAAAAPPFREHLAQHFATTYARIGLPEPYPSVPEI